MSQQGEPTASVVIDALAAILAALVPAGDIAGFTITEIVAIVKGIVAGVPEVVAAYGSIKAAVDGGAAPTAEQIAALKAAVDAADDQLQQDIAAADAGEQT